MIWRASGKHDRSSIVPFIGDLDANIKDAAVKVLKYVDDSKLLMTINNEEDVYSSQLIMEDLYLGQTKII